MHFWIDKPTRCPRIQGRRYRMNVPKSHFASHHHHRYAIDDVAGLHMFSPLPRFQNNDVSSAGPSNPRSVRPSVQESVDRNDVAQPGCQLGQENASNINPNDTGNNQHVLPQSTNDTNRSLLLNVLECNEADLRVYNVGITLITVIAFLAITRFYFDYQQSEGIQVIVIFGLLAFLLLYRCIIRILCPTVPPNHRHHHHHNQETPVSDPIATVTVLNTISNESISDVSMPIRQNPPPPYHIAILIPPPTSPDEAPPPAYDKIIH